MLAWTRYMHERGKRTEHEHTAAAKWYEAGAERSDAGAQDNANGTHGLARLYRDGLGVEVNFETRQECYLRAAEQELQDQLGAY